MTPQSRHFNLTSWKSGRGSIEATHKTSKFYTLWFWRSSKFSLLKFIFGFFDTNLQQIWTKTVLTILVELHASNCKGRFHWIWPKGFREVVWNNCGRTCEQPSILKAHDPCSRAIRANESCFEANRRLNGKAMKSGKDTHQTVKHLARDHIYIFMFLGE